MVEGLAVRRECQLTTCWLDFLISSIGSRWAAVEIHWYGRRSCNECKICLQTLSLHSFHQKLLQKFLKIEKWNEKKLVGVGFFGKKSDIYGIFCNLIELYKRFLKNLIIPIHSFLLFPLKMAMKIFKILTTIGFGKFSFFFKIILNTYFLVAYVMSQCTDNAK